MVSSMVTTKLLDFLFLISFLAFSTVRAKPNAMAEAYPFAMAKADPNAMAKASPDAMAEADPNAMAGAFPDAMAKADPNAMAKAYPDAMAEAYPDAMAEAYPDAMADAEPWLKMTQHIIQRIKPSPYQKCDKDEECIKAYTYCIDRHCKCLNTYKMNDDLSCSLIGGPGSSCESSSDCKAPDSTCKNEKCECAEGMVTDGSFCLTSTGYDGACEKVIQCPNQDYFVCTNGKCQCSDDVVFIVGAGCLPRIPLGGNCEYDTQCSVKIPNSQCNNRKCSCISNFQVNAAEDACVPASFEVDHDVITDDVWNPNYATAGHAENIDYAASWTNIFLTVDGIMSIVSMTFENSGGKTLVHARLQIANPDKTGTRRRRRSLMNEPEGNMKKKPDKEQPQAEERQPQAEERQAQAGKEEGTMEGQPQTVMEEEECALVKTLKERELKELSSPIPVSAPEILMQGDVMDKFCLQNIDCPSLDCQKFACM